MEESTIKNLEKSLDDFNADVRNNALDELIKIEGIEFPEKEEVNLHAHTFYSYNAYGYSPSHYAWLAKKRGLAVAGIVDFDVLDGLDEFMAAGQKVQLKVCAGIESRVFVPEFSTRVINSPGEPGVSYHVGVGFVSSAPSGWAGEFLAGMKKMAAQRNKELVGRVNQALAPVELDMDADVFPLTPAGNATERHICQAYARKAVEVLGTEKAAEFWKEKLGVDDIDSDMPEGPKLLDTIRAKMMKRGGVGYVQPGKDTFPDLKEMNRFILEAGAIPVITWLDGTSEGEQDIDELLEVEMASGAAMINIIPDRNFTSGVEDEKLRNLRDIMERVRKLGLPVLVGTEMNKLGNLFVDEFDSAELSPFRKDFMDGAYILYAHTVLRRESGIGYLGEWANEQFKDVFAKNEFFAELGRKLQVKNESVLRGADKKSADEILALL